MNIFGIQFGRDDDSTSSHAAATPEDCDSMARRNNWKLVETRPNGNRVLPVDCVFEGKTKFPNYVDRDDD